MDDEQRSYEQIPNYSREDVQAALSTNDSETLKDIVIGVSMYDRDQRFAEELCIRLGEHEDSQVRGNAILGLGHVARRFRRLDSQRAKSLIESGLTDQSEYVRGQAWAAADDVTFFLHWDLQGFTDE